METYYTIYKITNQVNGKIYIGCHKTGDLDDNYMGSGKYLKYSINKHGIENFTKEILHVFDSPEEMFEKEAEIVTEEFIAEENTYNLKIGGSGGFDYINNNGLNNPENFTVESLRAYKEGCRKGGRNTPWSKAARIVSVKALKEKYPEGTFKDKKHSEKSKQKIGKANAISQLGEKNSQYGKRWIYSLEEKRSTRIGKNELLPDGWLEGRKIKF